MATWHPNGMEMRIYLGFRIQFLGRIDEIKIFKIKRFKRIQNIFYKMNFLAIFIN